MAHRRRIIIDAAQRNRIGGAAAGREARTRRRRRQDDLTNFRTRTRRDRRADVAVVGKLAQQAVADTGDTGARRDHVAHTVLTDTQRVAVTGLDRSLDRHQTDLVHIGAGVADRRHRGTVGRRYRRLQIRSRIDTAQNDRVCTLTCSTDHGADIRVGANGSHQTGTDRGNRITGLGRIAYRMRIRAIRDAEAVRLTFRDAGQFHLVNLVQAGNRIVQDVDRNRRVIQAARVVERLGRGEERVGRAVDAKALAVDAVTAAVLAVGFPSHHEAAVVKRGDRRIILFAARVGVDPELTAEGVAIGVITLTVDAIARTILTTGLPGDHKTTVQQRRDVRHRLLTRGVGIGLELVTDGIAVLVITLTEDAVGVCATVLIVGLPGDDKATVGKPGCRWLALMVLGIGIDPELTISMRRTVSVKALAIGVIVTGSLILVPRLPGDHEAAVFKRSNRRIGLCIRGLRVDLELIADRAAINVIALAVDAV